MKMKTLRRKHENPEYREFASLDEYGMCTHQHPYALGEEATIEALREYCAYYSHTDIDWNEYEIVEIEYFESGVIGADIRNKLTPPSNLVSLLEVYYNSPELVDKDKMMELIRREMDEVKKSVEYLAKLLD